MSDGVSSMTVLSAAKDRKSIRVRANTDVLLEEQKFAYVPGASVDVKAVQFGVEHDVDFIAVNVASAAELRELRTMMGPRGAEIGLVAKIASIAALENIDEILASPDCAGIVVSRGDLGVIIPEEQVFVAQKKIISTANVAHKPVITATQMLYSMIRAPRPTRAECTDVANAILDGCDAVVLSGETEQGDYPTEACEMMVQICHKADAVVKLGEYSVLFEDLQEMNRDRAGPNAGLATRRLSISTPRGSNSGLPLPPLPLAPVSKSEVTEVISAYAVRIAVDSAAQVIVTLTESGTTSRVVAKYRPRVPLLCITSSRRVASQLTISRAAVPFLVPSIVNSDELIAQVLQKAKAQGLCTSGGKAVAVLGDVEGVSGSTNCFKIVIIP
jgi:pyruvate kinase